MHGAAEDAEPNSQRGKMSGDGKPIWPSSDNGYIDNSSHICEVLSSSPEF